MIYDKKYDKAVDLLRKAGLLSPGDEKTALLAEAEAIFLELEAGGEDDIMLDLSLGRCYKEQGLLDKAIERLRLGTPKPSIALTDTVLLELAICLKLKGSYDEAMKIVLSQLEEDPDRTRFLELHSELLELTGVEEDPMATNKQLGALFREVYELYQLVSQSRYKPGKAKEAAKKALPLFDQIIAIDPYYQHATSRRAECYYHLGRVDEAIEGLLKAAEHWGKWGRSDRQFLAEIYIEQKEFQKAIDQYTYLIENHWPLLEFWHEWRAKLYRKLDRIEEAKADEQIYQDYLDKEQAKWDDPNHYYHYK